MKLKQALQALFPDIAPSRLVGGFDRVGDIALVMVPPELSGKEREIGETILQLHKNIRVVAQRAGHYSGEYRTLPLSIIAGEQRLTTLHRENGINLYVDLGQVYFSTRSAHERMRVANLVSPNETVAVLCSGIGPFPLIIAGHSKADKVIGIEKNPAAHALAVQNLQANRKITGVYFIEGDAARIVPELHRQFDRMLVVLPYGGETLLPGALDAIKPGGALHYYDMQAKGCSSATLAKVQNACAHKGRCLQRVSIVTCGHCGSAVQRICLDAVID